LDNRWEWFDIFQYNFLKNILIFKD